MRTKHPHLIKDEQGRLAFHCKSQGKQRNTESLYLINEDELYMAGVRINDHPKFEDIVQFEDWCNVFWVENTLGL